MYPDYKVIKIKIYYHTWILSCTGTISFLNFPESVEVFHPFFPPFPYFPASQPLICSQIQTVLYICKYVQATRCFTFKANLNLSSPIRHVIDDGFSQLATEVTSFAAHVIESSLQAFPLLFGSNLQHRKTVQLSGNARRQNHMKT